MSITILNQQENSYYLDNEEDFKIWLEKLNIALQNKFYSTNMSKTKNWKR
jgi:fructose-1,6-bisphosphatase